MPILETRLTDLADEKSKLEGYITALQAKRREMRDALADFRKSREQQSSPTGTATGIGRQGTSVQVRGERAAEAFDRIFQRQTGLAGTSGTSDATAAKLVELEELTRRNRIAERLAQLKAGQA
jgi:phage shock protein A